MRHVAILIETSRAYGRGLLRGIARYNRDCGQWSTYFLPQGLGDPAPAWLADWRGDGILARIDNRHVARAVQQAGVPVVNMRGTFADLPYPFVGSDNRAIARLAADHLLERGFKHFGFYGYPQGFHPKFDLRRDCFQHFIKRAGHQFYAIQEEPRKRPRSWEQQQAWIAGWLAGLPKPVAVMAANDDLGLQLLDACRRKQIAVPDQVAVLGVDNDEYLCGLALPPLSSIDVNSEETGYRAAALLDRMMAGGSAPKRIAEIKPAGVIVRRSTDVLATEDSDVIRAIGFIREHACRPIKAIDVVRHVSVSRSSLEPRFRMLLGRTLHQEIRKVQIAKAVELLADIEVPIKQVALRCGFKNVQYLTRVFCAAVGQPPAEFRRSHKQNVDLVG